MTAAPPQRILLLQLYHLGDVLLTTPTIRAARAAFPHALIHFATSPLGAQALEGNARIDALLIKPTLLQLYRARYDAVVDMHSVPRTARMVAATRARIRIGLRGRGPRNLAYTKLLAREPGPVYMALQKLRLLRALGLVPEGRDLSLEICLGEAEKSWAAETSRRLGLGAVPLVAISPVARHQFKQWGAANWARVGDAIAESGAQILITSGPGEESQAQAVAAAMTYPAVWQYGTTTVRQLAALYARCALWIGNDGGPKHLAVAARTPTITVYRRRLGGVWSDPNDANQIAIDSGADTLDAVTPERVVAPALRVLSRHTA